MQFEGGICFLKHVTLHDACRPCIMGSLTVKGHLYSKEPTQNYIRWNIHTHCTVQNVYIALDVL